MWKPIKKPNQCRNHSAVIKAVVKINIFELFCRTKTPNQVEDGNFRLNKDS